MENWRKSSFSGGGQGDACVEVATTPAPMENWRKSHHSGPGDGDSCVEISNRRTRIAVRDSKTPTQGTLSFPVGVVVCFIEALKLAAPAGHDHHTST